MKGKLLTGILLIIALQSCSKDDNFGRDTEPVSITTEECLSQHYYYYQGEPILLADRLRGDYVLVGFDQSVPLSKIVLIINNINILENIDEQDIVQVNKGYNVVPAKFKTAKICPEIYSFIHDLNGINEVAFTNYVFEGGFWIGDTTYTFMSTTDEFLVKVFDASDLTHLETVAQETNTTIKSHESGNWFLMSANKSSTGNAVDIANYFFETGYFQATEPNFVTLMNEELN